MTDWTSLLTIERVDAFGAGVYVLMAVIHLDLWLHRKDRPTHLWLAISALGALLVNITGQLVRPLLPNAPQVLVGLNMMGVALALVSLYELVQAVGLRPVTRRARVFQVLVFIPVVGGFFSSAAVLGPALLIMAAGFLVAAMHNAIHDARRGDVEARMLAAGLVFLFVTLMYDVVSSLRLLPRTEGMPVLGFTVLFLAAARALSTRFEREYQELQSLRAHLELRVQQRTADLEEANRKLDALAQTDALTGLPNRRSFAEQADRLLVQHHRAGSVLSVVMVDVDHFKRINDEFGHHGGDMTLRAVAQALRGALRDQDIVARWGGEEFIALLPDTDGAGAVHVAETLRQAVAGLNVAHNTASIRVTASFGLAVHDGKASLEATTSRADAALYRAKRDGRNRVAVG